MLNGLLTDIGRDVLIKVILSPLVSLLTEIRQTVVTPRTVFLNMDSNQRDKSNTPVNVAQIHRYSGLYFLTFILLQMVTFEVLLEGLSTPTVVHHHFLTIPHEKLRNS